MSIFKRTQRKYVKKAYRVRNWREYEAGLRNRGSLTVWISLTAGKLVNWDAPRPRRRKPGRQRKYSNLRNFDLWDSVLAYQRVDDPRFFQLRSLSSSPVQTVDRRLAALSSTAITRASNRAQPSRLRAAARRLKPSINS